MTVRARTAGGKWSLVVGGSDRSAMGLGQPVGSTVGNAQQHGDQQQRGDHEERLVPTPLMCEDHPDDRTVWGTSRERRPF